MNSSTLLLGALILLGVGAVITVFIARYRTLCGYVAFAVVLVASIWIAIVATAVLAGASVSVAVPTLTVASLESTLVFAVDKLGAVFLLITCLVAPCATLFSVRYLETHQRFSLARYYPPLLLFFASIICVLSVHNMLFFLHFWEFMTLTSYALVVFYWVDPESRQGGLVYFIATHVGTGCMLVATLILYAHAPTKSLEFADLREAMTTIMATSPALTHLVLGLFVIGFATKAGILPFGFWLPHAHPVAPSPFSAVLSGCMVKAGVYGLLVAFTSFLPLSRFTTMWGAWIAVLGTASIFIGTLTALQQSDSKRLLAFHTIGQMGYIWLGVGAGLALLRISPTLAVVALTAGLFHAVNHACFKTLLFLNAGAALYRTGTRNMDKAGGLMYIMPITAATAIVASLSIAGVPGFNGFVSKWLIFASTIMGGYSIPSLVFLSITGIFISAVTLASFLKFLGMLFVGKLQIGPEVERREVPTTMVIPQVVVGIFCILFGVLPVLAMRPLYTAVSGILPGNYAPAFASLFGSSLVTVNLSLTGMSSASWGPIVVLVAFAGCLVLAYFIFRMGGAQTRTVPMWLCGEEHPFAEVRYPVHSFLLPFNRLFAKIYPPIAVPRLPRPSSILRALDIDKWFYYPGVRIAEWIVQTTSRAHIGVPQMYMLWVIGGAILSIIVIFAMGGGL